MTSKVSTAHELGKTGESAAVNYLEAKGYEILAQGFRYQHTEIDIIACHGQTVVFVEVKTRRNERYGFPEEAVDTTKQTRIKTTAAYWLSRQKQKFRDCRFDILSIIFRSEKDFEIFHLRDAF